MPVELKISNVVKTVDVEPDTPPLWVLRNTLDLHGTKYGCGMGLCGACTAMVAGQAVRSCLTQISSVIGKLVITIEGLSPGGTHPVQMAWKKLDVPQCGHCQAGQIMSATALLSRTPAPDRRRHRRRHERQSLPLRNLPPHPAGHPRGRNAPKSLGRGEIQ